MKLHRQKTSTTLPSIQSNVPSTRADRMDSAFPRLETPMGSGLRSHREQTRRAAWTYIPPKIQLNLHSAFPRTAVVLQDKMNKEKRKRLNKNCIYLRAQTSQAEDPVDEQSWQHITHDEEDLAKHHAEVDVRGEQPGQERGVAVRWSVVRRLPLCKNSEIMKYRQEQQGQIGQNGHKSLLLHYWIIVTQLTCNKQYF